MTDILPPDFGVRYEHRMNRSARVTSFDNAAAESFESCCALYIENGYTACESYVQGTHRFAALKLGGNGVFINYYGGTQELRVVEEENCAWFDRADKPKIASVAPQITQIALEDFGMSYAIRLSDGRFIVIDGGCSIEAERHKLFRCLKAGSPFDKPVIAAWIFTHPHSDHFHCFMGFMESYAQEVDIESFMFNFPECDDLEHYPAQASGTETPLGDQSSVRNVPIMLDWVARSGAAVYAPHTGQRYSIGDATLEILSSMDDTIHLSKNINCTSLAIRMTLGGQVILWAADADMNTARMPERYGNWLNADILQIPHHGFQSGKAEGELAAYALIKPKVCLLPAADFTAYIFFCAWIPGTRSLMLSDEVEEFITGTEERTLTLPYTAPANAMRKTQQLYRQGQDCAGARAWVFTGLSTGRPEDLEFTLLNMAVPAANIIIETYFEESKLSVREIRAVAPGMCIKQLNIFGDEVDGNTPASSTVTIKNRGIPENKPFAVRFLSDNPIVVSHREHSPVYHSTL